MNYDLHIHSNYSFDSLMRPGGIVKAAKLRGLSIISVTDHGNMDIYENEFSPGHRERIFQEHDLFVIPGVEVKTNCGDMIGLFVEEEITGTEFDDVISQIRSQNGLVVLPHPYHRDVDPVEIISEVDLVESINGRCRSEQNYRAIELAKEERIPIIGGSDAHMYWEIGQIQTHFEEDITLADFRENSPARLKNMNRTVQGSPLPFLMTHGVSFASGRLKRLLGLIGQ